MVDPARIRRLNEPPGHAEGAFVLYWMIAARRTRTNPALELAIETANERDLPLFVFEPLRAGYRWASVRHHTFLVQGMADQAARFEAAGVRYRAWLERRPGAGRGLLQALAAQAAVVITDDTPAFHYPAMLEAAASQVDAPMLAVDGVGLLPLAASPRAFTTAASFRRHLQKTVLDALEQPAAREPLLGYRQGLAPDLASVFSRFEEASAIEEVEGLDASVGAVESMHGGENAAQVRVGAFLEGLSSYVERNHPDAEAASGLSPWLHFGHVSGEEVARRVLESAGWEPGHTPGKATGSRGWWGLPEGAEAFMDELVTWRELSQVFALHTPDHAAISSIPDWATQTLLDHAADPRQLVPFEALDAARSPDPLWNAAQRQLVESGTMHNYLRMLWGKNVLGWAPSPELAFAWLTHWNNKYALDGRDPNSASGIAWVFGRHDRAWGPERPIFGKVRYMTSRSTEKKLRLGTWLERWGR